MIHTGILVDSERTLELGVSEHASRSRGWVGPMLLGLAIGAGAAGAPLAYRVLSVQAKLRETAKSASEARANNGKAIAQLQAKLKESRKDSARVQAQLVKLRTTASSTAKQLKEQRALSAELAKPAIPLRLSVRKAFLDSGYVLQIRNPTPNDIEVAATFKSVDGHKMQRRLVIDANGATEIGQSQGWAFAPKDVATFKMPGHKDLIYMIPVY